MQLFGCNNFCVNFSSPALKSIGSQQYEQNKSLGKRSENWTKLKPGFLNTTCKLCAVLTVRPF